MNTLKYCAIIYIACLVLIISCKEEDYFHEPYNTKAMENDYPAIVSGNGIYDEETSPVPTILGNVRVNPYTVANMKQAWNNLNPTNQIVTISPTQLYVKFSPAGESDYKLLANTNESVERIVYLTGFSEPSTFYRAFKRWTNETPVEYRKRTQR